MIVFGLSTPIWKIPDIAGKIWKVQILVGKIWKILDRAARFGKFQILQLTRVNSSPLTHHY